MSNQGLVSGLRQKRKILGSTCKGLEKERSIPSTEYRRRQGLDARWLRL